MEGNSEVPEKRRRPHSSRRAKRRASGRHHLVYPYELRRKAVQLCLEEGFPPEQVARELGVGFSTLGHWVRVYRTEGEAGLQGKLTRRRSRPQVAPRRALPPAARRPRT